MSELTYIVEHDVVRESLFNEEFGLIVFADYEGVFQVVDECMLDLVIGLKVQNYEQLQEAV